MAWNMNAFITPEFLGTFFGAVAVVTTLTQLAKQFVTRLDPKWISLVFAVVVSVVKQMASADFTMVGWILAMLNALLLVGAASGSFEVVKSAGAYFGQKKEAADHED